MNSNCDYCNEVCWQDEPCEKCHGKGKKIGFTIGLGFGGALPAYSEQVCDRCCGTGRVITYRCPNYRGEQ